MLRNMGRENVLGWVGIQHGADRKSGSINLLDLKTLENERHDLPGRPGFYAETDEPGTVLIGLERRLVLYRFPTRQVIETGIEIEPDERVIINDGLAASEGVLFGTKDTRFQEYIAHMYFYDFAKRKLVVVKDDRLCSNGKFFFERDGRRLLADIDSPRQTVELFDAALESDALTNGRVLADFTKLPGVPDGMRPTPDGRSVVVAFYDPDDVEFGIARQVSLADGAIEAEWRFPGSPRVTCPEFVMIDGQVKLLCTTAVEGMPDERRSHAPHAGEMYIADTAWDRLPEPPPLVPSAVFANAGH